MRPAINLLAAVTLFALVALLPGCSSSDPVALEGDEITIFPFFVPAEGTPFKFRVVIMAIVRNPNSGVRRGGVEVLFRITSGAGLLDRTQVITNDDGQAFVLVEAATDSVTVEAISGTATESVELDESGANVGTNQPPTAKLTYSPSNPGPGDTVTFKVGESTDPEDDLDSWQITDYGDGNSSDKFEFDDRTEITYKYILTGDYDVTLLVWDGGGKTDDTTVTVPVQ